jgi:2-succinyl-5-enolpyruvyl-6-hydroxy-3-cyclohexene-1-carboxylate synthase
LVDQLSHAEVLGRYCGAFAGELVAAGVENVCLCPGSRSTPLALTFARHPGIKLWMHLDERSCAYFALGLSKASGKPVAILCSSGTAAVNFAPAVVEAFHSHVPLIVLTADRPPELQGLGSNQTIDQQNLYGSAVKWFSEALIPEASEAALRHVRLLAARAVTTANVAPRGPVHLNFPFREPLTPVASNPQEPPEPLRVSPGLRHPYFAPDYAIIYENFFESTKALIVCGEMNLRFDPNPEFFPMVVTAVAEENGLPILADALSQLRWPKASPNVITGYDAFLREPNVVGDLRPDVVLRFGAPPTSKPLQAFLDRLSDVPQIVVSDGGWPDPGNTATRMIHADPATFLNSLGATLSSPPPVGLSFDRKYLERFQRLDRVVSSALPRLVGDVLSEITAIADMVDLLPEGAAVVAGNSMPVRDIDSFMSPGPQKVRCYANRGASGIDGVVSTALGAAAVSDGPTVLVIGDLSFYHDMNGLLAAQRFGLRATIVLINNDGGGIFSFLPQHEDAEYFEQLWGTPHGLDFSHVAGLYGVGFQRVSTRQEYRDALKASFRAPGVQVIEVRTDREENLRLHQRIWDEVAKAVADLTIPSPGGEAS